MASEKVLLDHDASRKTGARSNARHRWMCKGQGVSSCPRFAHGVDVRASIFQGSAAGSFHRWLFVMGAFDSVFRFSPTASVFENRFSRKKDPRFFSAIEALRVAPARFDPAKTRGTKPWYGKRIELHRRRSRIHPEVPLWMTPSPGDRRREGLPFTRIWKKGMDHVVSGGRFLCRFSWIEPGSVSLRSARCEQRGREGLSSFARCPFGLVVSSMIFFGARTPIASHRLEPSLRTLCKDRKLQSRRPKESSDRSRRSRGVRLRGIARRPLAHR